MAYGTRTTSTARNEPVRRASEATAQRARETRESIAAEGITYPVIVGLVHLLIVQLVASLAYRFGTVREDSAPFQYVPQPLDGWAGIVVEPFRQWDGFWYKLLAEQGYAAQPSAYPAFWPLYPWLMRGGERLTGLPTEVVGYLISNVAFILALIVVYRLVALDFDRTVARRTLVALALFPTAFFFSAVYTESLFLLLAAGALLAARTQGWFLAGLLGLLAALTRSQGVLLLAPFAVLFLQQHRLDWRRWFPNALWALLPAGGPALFAWILDRQGIDPLAFVEVQEQWWRFQATPIETFRCAIVGCYPPADHPYITEGYIVEGANWSWLGQLIRDPSWANLTSSQFREALAQSETLELISTVFFLALAAVGLRYLPLYHSAYVWPALLIPLFSPSAVHPLFSIPRFGIVLFPLFVMLALLFERRREAIPALAVSTLLLILLTAQFAQWYWVS
jgi:hypothetical protein